MESSSRKLQEEQKKQDEIRKQIALLQSQLVDLADEEPRSPARTGSKRTQDSEGNSNHRDAILAPPTPSPKKKRKLDLKKDPDVFRRVSKSLDFKPSHGHSAAAAPLSSTSISKGPEKLGTSGPAPSNLLNKLADMANNGCLNRGDMLGGDANKLSRSMSFTDAAASVAHKRDEDLSIIEDIVPGPY